VETPRTYIRDYTIQLSDNETKKIQATIQLEGEQFAGREVSVSIPDAKIEQVLKTDDSGKATVSFKAKLQLWSPETPKLYDVIINTIDETIQEKIGFRTIEAKGTDILLNGNPVFLRGVNIHEEIPMREGRAYSEADAALLLREAKKLGCNFIRFAHISPFEKM